MSVTDTRRLPRNPQVVRRRRRCDSCGTSFQTDERPRLWINRGGRREPFLRGVLLASLRRAADGNNPQVPDKLLSEAVRRVVVGLLAAENLEPTAEQIRTAVGTTLRELDLEDVAFRYDPSSDPFSFAVGKRGRRRSEPFDRDKLKQSVLAASAKFLDASGVEQVVDQVESELGGTSAAVDTDQIRQMVCAALRSRDERAFLRYALGGPVADRNLDEFLDRVSPVAQVRKRDGAVVLFERAKLAKSIRLSFLSGRRDAQAAKISSFVAAEERRIRKKMTLNHQPEPTANIGTRVLYWLLDRDEIAWANYWLTFASDHALVAGASPAQRLAEAQNDMREAKRAREARKSGRQSD